MPTWGLTCSWWGGSRPLGGGVGGDAWLLRARVEQRVGLQVVPAQVEEAQAGAHHNQHFVVPPHVPQAHGEGAPPGRLRGPPWGAGCTVTMETETRV